MRWYSFRFYCKMCGGSCRVRGYDFKPKIRILCMGSASMMVFTDRPVSDGQARRGVVGADGGAGRRGVCSIPRVGARGGLG
jgi:hypothetical protein